MASLTFSILFFCYVSLLLLAFYSRWIEIELSNLDLINVETAVRNVNPDTSIAQEMYSYDVTSDDPGVWSDWHENGSTFYDMCS